MCSLEEKKTKQIGTKSISDERFRVKRVKVKFSVNKV